MHAFLESLYPTFAAVEIEGGRGHPAEAATVSSIVEALRDRAPQLWHNAVAEYRRRTPASMVPVVATTPTSTSGQELGRFLDSLYPAFARMVKHEGDWLRMDYRTVPVMAEALRSRDATLWQEASEAAELPETQPPPAPAQATPHRDVVAHDAAPEIRPSALRRIGRRVLWGIAVLLWCLWALPAFLDALGLVP